VGAPAGLSFPGRLAIRKAKQFRGGRKKGALDLAKAPFGNRWD
jgi:hypothetical protein